MLGPSSLISRLVSLNLIFGPVAQVNSVTVGYLCTLEKPDHQAYLSYIDFPLSTYDTVCSAGTLEP